MAKVGEVQVNHLISLGTVDRFSPSSLGYPLWISSRLAADALFGLGFICRHLVKELQTWDTSGRVQQRLT